MKPLTFLVSLQNAAKTIAKSITGQYSGEKSGNPPGIFTDAIDSIIDWAASPAIWDALIDYWYLTGDAAYNDIVTRGLSFQLGPDSNFMPPNQTKSEVGFPACQGLHSTDLALGQ